MKPFRGVTESGRIYFIKIPDHGIQGARVLATEQIVPAIGRLIEAPVCETALIEISEAWAGEIVGPGVVLEKCIAHGSLVLNPCEESRDQLFMKRDDNARRWARWAALWDWCLGSDEQWLYAQDYDNSMWSFDHNMWINDEAEWSAASCNGQYIQPWVWRGDWKQLDAAELKRVADRLYEIDRAQLQDACYAVPEEWDVPKDDLDALVDMLQARKAGVAARLRVKSGEANGGKG